MIKSDINPSKPQRINSGVLLKNESMKNNKKMGES